MRLGNPQSIGKGAGKLGNKRTSRDHPDFSIIKIGENTEKSPGDLRRLAVTQTPVLGNKRMNIDNPKYSIAEIGENRGESWRLKKNTCCHTTFNEKPLANTGVKYSQRSKHDNNKSTKLGEKGDPVGIVQ